MATNTETFTDRDMITVDATELAERYVEFWNEPDASTRATMIRTVFAPQFEHLLVPPEDARDRASALGFGAQAFELRGYAAIERRAAIAYDEFVAPGEHFFRSRGNAARLRNIVTFNWDYVARATGEVVGGGLEVLAIDDVGRVITDYQFPL
jgi:hypothetical protein